uniref:Syn-copalyl diphosphate synthase n=1 Tax=Aegilops tauschii TaxID=37682 RepID=N1QYY8_AEGTA
MSRLVEEEQDWMPCGFEINFPALLEKAKDLDLDIPYDDPVLEEIYAKRNLKLSKIPLDVLHAIPTTLLFSVEGMVDLPLDWETLLRLRCPDGSFHSSPAATAAALSHTGDKECHAFLDRLIQKFEGGEAVTTHFRHIGGPCYSTENLEELIDLVSFDDVSGGLREAWKQWLMAWTAKESHGSVDGDTALLFVRTIEICSGRIVSAEQKLNLWHYSQLEQLTSSICHKLATIGLSQNEASMENTEDLHRQVDLEMQELSWRVHQGCHGINRETRQTFLNVVKSFY